MSTGSGLDGGPPELLTAAAGTHEAMLAPDGRHLLDTFSSLDTPPRLDLYTVAGRRRAHGRRRAIRRSWA